jgi:hypothetical protein
MQVVIYKTIKGKSKYLQISVLIWNIIDFHMYITISWEKCVCKHSQHSWLWKEKKNNIKTKMIITLFCDHQNMKIFNNELWKAMSKATLVCLLYIYI